MEFSPHLYFKGNGESDGAVSLYERAYYFRSEEARCDSCMAEKTIMLCYPSQITRE